MVTSIHALTCHLGLYLANRHAQGKLSSFSSLLAYTQAASLGLKTSLREIDVNHTYTYYVQVQIQTLFKLKYTIQRVKYVCVVLFVKHATTRSHSAAVWRSSVIGR